MPPVPPAAPPAPARTLRASERRTRVIAIGVSVTVHGAILAALLSAHVIRVMPAEPAPTMVALVALPRPPKPPAPKEAPRPASKSVAKAAPAKAAPVAHAMVRPRPTPPAPSPLPAAEHPAPVAIASLTEAELAGAATAGAGDGEGEGNGGGGGGGGCNMIRRLQAALRKDHLVQAATHAPAAAGKAVRVWDGDWVQSGGEDGRGLAAVREAIIWEIAFAPAACRAEPVRGLVVLSMNEGSGSTRLALGQSASWRWSDLLHPRGQSH